MKPSSHAARAAKGPGAVASAQPRGERRESRQCFSSCFLLLPPEALSTGAEGAKDAACYRDGGGAGGGGGGGLRSSPPREGMTPPRIALPGVLACRVDLDSARTSSTREDESAGERCGRSHGRGSEGGGHRRCRRAACTERPRGENLVRDDRHEDAQAILAAADACVWRHRTQLFAAFDPGASLISADLGLSSADLGLSSAELG